MRNDIGRATDRRKSDNKNGPLIDELKNYAKVQKWSNLNCSTIHSLKFDKYSFPCLHSYTISSQLLLDS